MMLKYTKMLKLYILDYIFQKMSLIYILYWIDIQELISVIISIYLIETKFKMIEANI
jgi:hypothetical protein